jgi:hypothetical protein
MGVVLKTTLAKWQEKLFFGKFFPDTAKGSVGNS